MRQTVLIPLLACLLGGCASTLSGLDGGSSFACKAPDGVTCASLSGVYASAVANDLPGTRSSKPPHTAKAELPTPITGQAPTSGIPIRSPVNVLRVWIAPWEDADGDLHDQSYLYLVSNTGRWQIEHQQKQLIERYRPTFLSKTTGKTATPASSTSADKLVLPGKPLYRQEDLPAATPSVPE